MLADLARDGQLATLARELGLPAAIVEALQLTPSTVEQVAGALNTSTERLSSTLAGAGATSGRLSARSPLAATPVSAGVEAGTSSVIGTRSGRGGLTLTTLNSSTPGASSSGASGGSRAMRSSSSRSRSRRAA